MRGEWKCDIESNLLLKQTWGIKLMICCVIMNVVENACKGMEEENY
jgi:hypothetical protein